MLFGGADILINNIAWAIRHLPIFGIFGDGQYRLQPIHVEDFADLAVAEGRAQGNHCIDAVGSETFTYRGLVEQIAAILGVRCRIVSVPPWLGHLTGWILGKWLGDVVVTRDEIAGLMQELLFTQSPPAGRTRLTDWVRENAATVGVRYASELARRRDRTAGYVAAAYAGLKASSLAISSARRVLLDRDS